MAIIDMSVQRAALDIPEVAGDLRGKLMSGIRKEFGDDVWRFFRAEEKRGTFKVFGVVSVVGIVRKFVERIAGPEPL